VSLQTFDDIVIDPGCFAVTKAGRPLALEPKAVTLLIHLVAHRDRVVTKDELTELLWKDTFVTPNALTRLIAQLRRELGDTATEARYIQTVHRRGYRFIAAVRVSDNDEPRQVAHIANGPALSRRGLLFAALAALILFATGAASYVARRTSGLPLAEAIRSAVTEQATDSLAFDTDPAISPDGRLLAWSSDASGRSEIYVRDLEVPGSERQLTTDGMENVEPAWSPDGKRIAYYSRARRGIWVMPAEGGSPARVTDFGSGPAWSPDGRRIAFGASGRVMAARTQIWSVGADGGDLTPLTTAGKPEGVHQRPAWSSDGSHLAFVAGTPGHATLWLQRLADGRLTQVREAHVIPALAFAADDSAIFWAEASRESYGRVWRRALDLSRSRVAGDVVEDETPGRVPVAGLSIIGNRMAYVATRLETNLWTLPVDRDGRPGTPRTLTRSTYRNTYPVFSPDGTRIAFQMKRPGSDTEVWTIAPSGGEPTPLVAGNPRGFFPNWLPGGQRVLAVERTAGGDQFAYLDVRSGRRDVVRALDREKHPRLSPDGRFVAFHAPVEGTLQVFVASIHGGPSRQLTFSPTDTAYPTWSPDGTRLVVEVRRGEDVQIALVATTGGPLEVITADRGLHWPHSWAPDNDRIAFAGETDGRWELYSISASTRERRQLTTFASPNGYVRYPAWSPDDTSIAFERATVRGNIWIAALARPAGDDVRRAAAVVDVDRVEELKR
jgi:Tol biopolymer transport system component/DNA-binding winged helix-turn-helix (wHTH) protein